MAQRAYRHPAVLAGRVGLTSVIGVAALLSVVGLPAPPVAPQAPVNEPVTAIQVQAAGPRLELDAVDLARLPEDVLSAFPEELIQVVETPAPRRRCGPVFLWDDAGSAAPRVSRCGLPADADR